MIYRDDDISVYTCQHIFEQIHQKFIAKKQVHTVGVIMKDLWENQALFYYLATAPLLEIGLHGWKHKNYSKVGYIECYEDLDKSLKYWNENSDRMIGKHKEIKIFFAPWNKSGVDIMKACENLGLQFCNVKKGKWQNEEIKSFHFWSYNESKVL